MHAFPRPFRFRLNCIDHYQAASSPLDPELELTTGLNPKDAPKVPVIRVFGATETGQKVCAHIHGAFPYMYIRYDGDLGDDEVRHYIEMLTLSINHALSLSYRRNPYDKSSSTFVAHVSLVKGVPFFGYSVGYKPFLKIYLLNPLNMTRLADLLIQGAVLARVFQPHESHMQYLAQWMCDYNLFGCNYIDCERVCFRSSVPTYDPDWETEHKWHDISIHADWMLDESDFPRQSHCTLEIDVCVQDITNRRAIKPRYIHHDFVERFQRWGPDEKFVHSMAGLWRDETMRRRKKMGLKDAGSSPFPPEVMVSMSAESRADKSDWIHEEEYRTLVHELIDQERKMDGSRPVEFDNFVKESQSYAHLQSAFESVEDLYPENLAKLKHRANAPLLHTEPPAVIVNEKSISQAQVYEDGYGSEDEAAKQFVSSQRDAVEMIPAIDKRNYDSENGGASPKDSTMTDTEKRSVNSEKETTASVARKPEAPATQQIGKDLTDLKRKRPFPGDPTFLGHHSAPEPPPGIGAASKSARSSSQQSSSGSKISPPSSSPHLFQPSIKASGPGAPNSLAFPVIKNPQSQDGELRLSQRVEYSNSQRPKTPRLRQSSVAKESDITPSSASKTKAASQSPDNKQVAPAILELSQHLPRTFSLAKASRCYTELPPSSEEVTTTLSQFGLQQVIYQDAFFSNELDVPDRPREYAGREFRLQSSTLPYLPEFDPLGNSPAARGEMQPVVRDRSKEEVHYRQRRRQCALRHWELSLPPPAYSEVKKWAKSRGWKSRPSFHEGDELDGLPHFFARPNDTWAVPRNKIKYDLSQIDGPTQKNRHGFKYSQKIKKTSVEHETQYMTLMSLEVHVNSRENLVPDPAEDAIACIFWSVQADVKTAGTPYRTGILVLSDEEGLAKQIQHSTEVSVEHEEDELDLLNRLVDLVRDLDPDILTGYEVHNGSWGYLMERARVKYEFDLCDELSRMKSQSHGRFGKDADRWGFTTTSTIRVTGRHMINIWRAMRGELNLLQYTMENVAFHLLHKRIPHYSFADLTRWFRSGRSRNIAKTVNYFLSRVHLDLQILEANELIPRTSEQARLLGVDFFSVFSRGSQFKVESIMFRIAKPENYILVSPSRKQVGSQNALECLPLVMEPQSAFYPSPLLVLDFQSLYPSVMIAYNYCYSTFLGRVVPWRGTNKMGFSDFKREPRVLELVNDQINIAPNGIMYVKPEMRKSLLAKMLGELLETRVMVKSGMKQDKDDKTLQQLLNNRQLALKLLANVTYGYTSASFSGRMPCSEIADSIVQTGRETLEKAIALIHSVERWGAEVVYGDTDSLFVYLKGRTRDQAFTIGEEIAAAVTNVNPRPIKLKFEKVYHPCVLLAKKRYVGFKYEHRNQNEPDFDAKGIETVRRDGTPAEQKMEEKALKILFRTADLSEVKKYFQAQCSKIMVGRVSIQDFLFAKEVRLGTYSDKGPPPPGALIATRRMLQDARQEPQYGERVPYVVITGAPGARLIDRCVDPERLLKDDQLELDAEYYISKNLIPPLERIFNLVGANVRSWYDEMPKVQRVRANRVPSLLGNAGAGITKKTMEAYLHATSCLVCRAKLPPPPPMPALGVDQAPPLPICEICMLRPAAALHALRRQISQAERRVGDIMDVCRSCSGSNDEVVCDSRDCPVFYTRRKEKSGVERLRNQVGTVAESLEEHEASPGLDW